MTLQLKAAKHVLIAAGYDATEISELIRSIKADAWDKGLHAGANAEHHTNWSNKQREQVRTNPYREAQS